MNTNTNSKSMSKPSPRSWNEMESIGIPELVQVAANVIAPVWPLRTFIAVNPLQGLEDLPFEQAVAESARYRKIVSDGHPGRDAVNRELIKWCAVFFDEGQATIPMPGRENGLYRAFADLVVHDSRLASSRNGAAFLRSLPHSAEDAIALCLDHLHIPESQREEFLRQSLAALPGWSGFVKWKERWQNPAEHVQMPASLADFLAVRLVLTCLLWPDARCADLEDSSPPNQLADLVAAESEYRTNLLQRLKPHAAGAAAKAIDRPSAQLVFCIDVRSEPFRRAIEAQGAYETLGFAGFFGIPVHVRGFEAEKGHDSCPVLLKPRHEVVEEACPAHADHVERHRRGLRLSKMPKVFYQSLKYNLATPFALVEMLGPWCGLWMLVRTFAPSYAVRFRQSAAESFVPTIEVTPSLGSIETAQQADYAEQALRLMGLTSRLAPVVVLCGHGSTAENNAFASSLDCGACGGNHGGSNARILATILNQMPIREVLAERGLPIPDDTVFVAAQHDTTTDEVKLFGTSQLTGEQVSHVERLQSDLARARTENAMSRSLRFGHSTGKSIDATAVTKQRSQDWAQVRPEWGLARNAAFVVGSRELTRNVDLEGRCFLHSYDWRADTEGKFLTTIMTAPMVVAQWINSQYLFSTLDNVAFGAGSKVTHNVTGKIGVMQGNGSDLMHGLPLQSVYVADGKPYHEPMRLLTVVEAPKSRLDEIIAAQDVLQKLFGNGWVKLACIDPTDGETWLLKRDRSWQKLG